MKRKPPALRSIGIDLDARAVSGFSCGYEVELVHGCCHRFLPEFSFDGGELVYSDPPYLRETRKSQRRYRHDYEDADHVALLELLKGLPCQVMVSGYPSALYDRHLAGWRSVSLQVMNHAGVVTEKVWFNFRPDRLHWARFAGRNFTDRQRIKRRAANWGRRYEALPVAERLAVLAAMLAVEADSPAHRIHDAVQGISGPDVRDFRCGGGGPGGGKSPVGRGEGCSGPGERGPCWGEGCLGGGEASPGLRDRRVARAH